MSRAMIEPVCCRFCGKVYDLAAAVPIARHADCTVLTSRDGIPRDGCCERLG
jgi:hypothetical protein